jgi:hypothetical protein
MVAESGIGAGGGGVFAVAIVSFGAVVVSSVFDSLLQAPKVIAAQKSKVRGFMFAGFILKK